MRTLAKLKDEEGIWMDEKAIPKPGYNDVLIKVGMGGNGFVFQGIFF